MNTTIDMNLTMFDAKIVSYDYANRGFNTNYRFNPDFINLAMLSDEETLKISELQNELNNFLLEIHKKQAIQIQNENS